MKPIQKFRGAAIAISKFTKMWLEYRNRRNKIKDIQINEFGKLIDLNIRISRSWIIKINS